jgi:hypothetical protein
MLNSDGFSWKSATTTADDSFLTSTLFGSEIHVMIRDTARRVTPELLKSVGSMRAIKPRVYCSKETFILSVGVCVLSVVYLVMIWNWWS